MPPGTPSASDQSKTRPDPGAGESTSTASAGPLATVETASSPAVNAWITNGTLRRTDRTSDSGSRPCSCAPCRPTVLTISTTRSGRSSRNTPMVIVPGGRRRTMSRTSVGLTWRGLPGDEVEAEGVGAQRDRQQGVLLVRDAADLHEHVYDGTGWVDYGNTITVGASPDRGTLRGDARGAEGIETCETPRTGPRDRLGDRLDGRVDGSADSRMDSRVDGRIGGRARGRVPATSSPATDPSSSAPTWSWSSSCWSSRTGSTVRRCWSARSAGSSSSRGATRALGRSSSWTGCRCSSCS